MKPGVIFMLVSRQCAAAASRAPLPASRLPKGVRFPKVFFPLRSLALRRAGSPTPPALLLAAAAVSFLTTGCGGDSPATPAPTPPAVEPPATNPTPPEEPAAVPDTATYRFAVPEVRISPRTPGTLPEGVDFAPPVGFVAHARDAPPFAVGRIASDGLKVLAERGASGDFLAEAEADSAEVIAASFAALLQVFLSTDPSIVLSSERPCLSYAQMIEPSPDWFIGFSNVCAIDEDGNWLEELSAELLAYDAGTADGDEFAFKAPGGDTEPREPLALLDQPPWFVSPAVVQVLTASRKEE